MDIQYQQQGYALASEALTSSECRDVIGKLLPVNAAGSRQLLTESWCRDLAKTLHRRLVGKFPSLGCMRAVQCTLFQKTESVNWLVPWHQDRSLPADNLHGSQRAGKIRIKDGIRICQPSANVVSSAIALRLHLDDCGAESGPLKVIPGSHKSGILTQDEINALKISDSAHAVLAMKGAVLAMNPLLVHSSAKAEILDGRRVLHYIYI